ncbi:hypothetical protein F7734_12865 [Scytonema sp. UIC 10036]|uniref:hypothetical protein n=1 Tax=Scytonema sp. UIC 10036 TaxID=2304196 RepID=UPI0012DA307D|nr:hypothetical protein [Scytonema sp. UIC 10036]MUG93273.1 hypothetical protein [Scytonema sp. UIC 10036]
MTAKQLALTDLETLDEVISCLTENFGSCVLSVLKLSKNKLKTIAGLTLQPLLVSKRDSLLKFNPRVPVSFVNKA